MSSGPTLAVLLLGAALPAAILTNPQGTQNFTNGSQLFSLTLNNLLGGTLTALLDAEMESYGGTTAYDSGLFPVTSEYNVHQVTLPAAVFAKLAAGSVQVRQ